MKIFLQHTRTGLYFQRPGVWIQEMEAAFDFGSSQLAMDYAHVQGTGDVRLIATFANSGYRDSIVYPISPAAADGARPAPQARL